MLDILSIWIWPLIAATARVSTPLIFAAMGGIVSERSGVINIALEGFMLIGALVAAVAAHHLHSPYMALAVASSVGFCFAMVYALFAIRFRADQIVAGTAMNILAMGVAPFVAKILYNTPGSTPALELSSRFTFEPVLMSLLLVAFVSFWLNKTSSGLWVSFAGEHPAALETAGVRVNRVRWWAVATSGALAAAGGATLSIFLSSAYSRNMTAGRGFMALAAMIFGKWKPIPTALACLFFGLTDALQMRLQGIEIGSHGATVPVQFIQVLPYLITMIVLAGGVGKSRAPSALGQNK